MTTVQQKALGAAEARWNDYLGTAAADDAYALAGHPSLYALAGLSREQWTIVGVDLSIWHDRPRVAVYAAERSELSRANGAGPDDSELAVTAFSLSGSQLEEFMNEAFREISVRLTARWARDQRFVVVAEYPARS